VLLSTGPTLTVNDLPPDLRRGAPPPAAAEGTDGIALPERGVVLDDLLKSLLDQALLRCGGNKSRAADLLGIHRDQVRYWVKKYGLEQWIRRAAVAGEEADDER